MNLSGKLVRGVAAVGTAVAMSAGAFFVAAPATAAESGRLGVDVSESVAFAEDGVATLPGVYRSARPGDTTGWAQIYDSSTRINGLMTLTAPEGTTFATVQNNIGVGMSISADGKTATADKATNYGAGAATVSLKLAIPSDAIPGTEFTGGSSVITDAKGEVVARGDIGAYAQHSLPDAVGLGAPGGTTSVMVISTDADAVNPATGLLFVQAPMGTTIVSVTTDSGAHAEIDPNGTEAVIDTEESYGGGAGNAYVTLALPEGAVPGAHYSGGSAVIVNSQNQELLGVGYLSAQVLSPLVISSPAEGSTIGTENIVFEGSGEPGEQVEVRDGEGNVISSAVIDEDGNWTLTISSLPEGPTDITIHSGAQVVAPQYTVVKSEAGSPVIDPLVAGGIALFALAGIGVVGFRRRATAASVA